MRMRTRAGATTTAESKVLREFFLGVVKVQILHHASRRPIYGTWFREELRRHNQHLSPGTLYPLLHDLEATGYLQREVRIVHGRVRKYYRITPVGRKALADARLRIRELVDELLGGDGSGSTNSS